MGGSGDERWGGYDLFFLLAGYASGWLRLSRACVRACVRAHARTHTNTHTVIFF